MPQATTSNGLVSSAMKRRPLQQIPATASTPAPKVTGDPGGMVGAQMQNAGNTGIAGPTKPAVPDPDPAMATTTAPATTPWSGNAPRPRQEDKTGGLVRAAMSTPDPAATPTNPGPMDMSKTPTVAAVGTTPRTGSPSDPSGTTTMQSAQAAANSGATTAAAPGSAPPTQPAGAPRPTSTPLTSQGTSQANTPTATSPTGSGVPSSSAPDPYSISAQQRDVTDRETVQGQLKGMLAEGSPLLEGARERAKRYAASRGLVNSAMAGQAGEEAVINTATPIATADAGTFSRQALVNQDAENQFRSADKNLSAQQRAAEAERTWQSGENSATRTSNEKMANQDAETRLRSASISADASLEGARIDASSRLQLGQMQLSTQEKIADKEIKNRLDLAGIDSNTRLQLGQMDVNSRRDINMSSLQQNTLTNYGNQVTAIMSNPNMSTEDKTAAVRNLNAIYGGSPYLPVNIDWTHNGTPPPPGANPPPPNSPGG